MELLKDLKSPWSGRSLLEQMKAAKTGKEMVDSWSGVLPSEEEHAGVVDIFKVFFDEAPEMIEYYCHKPLIHLYQNSKLDPKVCQLIMLGICAAMGCSEGIDVHAKIAIQRGATKDEVIDTLFLAGYEHSKIAVINMAEGARSALAGSA